jgi:SAM-dependent methyltransferase
VAETLGIARHYSSGALTQRLRAALKEDGADPERPTAEALAPYDQFHGRGIEATEDLARLVSVQASDRLLDVGSGIGGPARYMHARFGCPVQGIDLTPEFCDVARALSEALGLGSGVSFQCGDALAMPFAGASFDGAYSMNVGMNIADKPALYREIRRVLKSGGWLALSEYVRGAGPAPQYPTPWAADAGESFLATAEETRLGLERAGLAIVVFNDTLERALEYGRRSRAAVEAGHKPPHRAVALIHGAEAAKTMAANVSRALHTGGLIPIEVLARKKPD